MVNLGACTEDVFSIRSRIMAGFRALDRPFAELVEDRRGLLDAARYEKVVTQIVKAMSSAIHDGHTVFWMGNGGSAADAQHMAAELSGRFLRERRALPSEALTVNTSALTAIANDFGYDQVFSRQVEAFVRPGDVVVGITTSGNSENVVRGLLAAKERGAVTVAFTGNNGGRVAAIADIVLVGPSGYAAIVQEIHVTLGHIICDLVEQEHLRLHEQQHASAAV
jgi:D-sedoheptulose 7-phosphate isomerase